MMANVEAQQQPKDNQMFATRKDSFSISTVGDSTRYASSSRFSCVAVSGSAFPKQVNGSYFTQLSMRPKAYMWKPQADITTFELAKCVPMFSMQPDSLSAAYQRLPDKCKRHWEVI